MLAVGGSRSALIFMHLLIYFCPALNLELPPDWSIDTGLFLHQNAAKSIQKSLPCRLMHRVEDATGLRPWLSCCGPRPAFKDSWWRDLHLRTARHKNGRRASCICLLTCQMPSLSTRHHESSSPSLTEAEVIGSVTDSCRKLRLAVAFSELAIWKVVKVSKREEFHPHGGF